MQGRFLFFFALSKELLPLLILSWVRRWRQQPIKRTLRRTRTVPDTTPTRRRSPEVPPEGVVKVGLTPREKVDFEDGGTSGDIEIFHKRTNCCYHRVWLQ